MDPETLYKAIEITKRDGSVTPTVLKTELGLENKEIQPILQTFVYTGFVDASWKLASRQQDEYIERVEKERDDEWKKKKEYEAWLAGAALTILVLIGALFI